MNKFVVVSLGLMAWSFWELSGGADFVPKSKRVAQSPVSKVDEVLAVKDAHPAVTEQLPIVKVTQSASLSTETQVVSAANPAPKPAPESSAISSTSTQPVVNVSSLATGLTSFATPGTPVFDLTPAVALTAIEDTAIPASAEVQPTVARDLREVRATRVNMRAGPGTSFGVVTVLDRGRPVEVLDQNNGGWLKLRDTETGQIGWMAARMVTAAN
ncbi:SH3 domain-containing protein [Shimia sp. MMG029]|uniref:SH3 domain-containing protein n=1 Tax=Shimia sp. MMG029 TaxID=3021978 RepID=UPI0022FE0FC1|nr:SH3 domain-containing protein [Shimia sp. MMG029]MDA5557649.1 SH3 domain-containing protein [Shimia sp. MMG029]